MNDRSIDRWGRTSAGFLARLAIRFVPTRTVLAMAKAKRTVHRLKSPSPRRPSQAFSAQHSMQMPEALGVFQKTDIEKCWPIIRTANIKVE
jgi:hypothetical protein